MSKNAKDSERAAASAKRKEEQARDGVIAMAEYQAEIKAERAKTAKLRALRLAKEARDAKAANEKAAIAEKTAMAAKADKPAKPKPKAAAKTTKSKKPTKTAR